LRANLDSARQASGLLMTSGDRLQTGLFVLCCVNLFAFAALSIFGPSQTAASQKETVANS
jgi:hypothetical protein